MRTVPKLLLAVFATFVTTFVVATFVATSTVYAAEPTPFDKWDAKDVERYKWTPESQEWNAEIGARFLTDLAAKHAGLAASVEDAVRYKIHDEETRKFARQKKFVLAAYGVMWLIVAAAAAAVVFRQRKLDGQIRDLEARIRASEAREGAA
jgi:hypothetical protein